MTPEYSVPTASPCPPRSTSPGPRARSALSAPRALALLLFAAGALHAPRAIAVGELTGRLAGYVFDPTGAALSEVPLTLSGGELTAPVSRTSGDDGRFEFDNLPPASTYVIEVNVPGFAPVRAENVSVRVGQMTPTDITLAMMTEAAGTSAPQTVTIVEKVNPIINPDSAQSVAVIDAEKAAGTPIFHQVEGMAQQVAGVGPGTRPVSRGGLARHGKFYVDGLDTTDITDGSITAPMNFDAVQNFEIITGGMDAQYNSMGAVTNAVTKNGTNKWTFDVNFTAQPTFLATTPNYPANQPPIFGVYGDNNTLPGPKTSFYSPVVNLGGPILADKLFFFLSYQQNFSHKENPLSILGVQENRPTDTTTTLGRIKLTWQLSDSDRLNMAFNIDHNTIENNIGSASVTDRAENRIDRGGEFFIVNYDHNFSDSTLFQLQAGLTYKKVQTDPMTFDYQSAAHYDIYSRLGDINSGSISAAVQGNFQWETKWRLQFDPTLSWKLSALGTHQMKAGIQTSYLIDYQDTGVSGGSRYTDKGGVCDPANADSFQYCYQRTDFYNDQLAQNPLHTEARALNLGLFFQDRWNVDRRLTIIPGIRFDLGHLTGNGGAFIANLPSVGPRLSATYDLFGDHRTLLSAHYGRSSDVGNIFVAQHANPSLLQITTTWDKVNNAFPTCVAGQANCVTAGGAAGRSFYTHDSALFGKTAPSPVVDEVSVGIKSEVVEETVLGVDYTYRYYGNMWADQEVNAILDPTGSRILGYKDPNVKQLVYVTKAADSAYRRYHGLDVWVQGTPGRWDLLASYTLAFNQGTVEDYFDGYLNNPRMTQFADGNLADDRRHALKGSISYKTPFGLDFGLRLQYRTGGALWESFSLNGTKVYRSQRGTGFPVSSATGFQDFNNPDNWTELRQPDTFILDVQARYNFQRLFKTKQKLELVLLVVNSLNATGDSSYTDSYSSSLSGNKFGFAAFHTSALQAELMFRVRQ